MTTARDGFPCPSHWWAVEASQPARTGRLDYIGVHFSRCMRCGLFHELHVNQRTYPLEWQ